MHFDIETFLRKLIRRKTSDRYRQSPILDTFRHRHFKVCFKLNNLMKILTLIDTYRLGNLSSMPHVFSRLEKPYGLILRVILGSLGPIHTSESVLSRQHFTMRLIGVGAFARDINKNVHSTSPIPDPSTEKATRWDVLALDTIRFREFKGLINNKSCISFYLVYQST
jgi:hypothetical protein